MPSNRWSEVTSLGQSLWYDNLSRSFIQRGALDGMIRDLGLRGITSNPSIFEKAISNGKEYDGDIRAGIAEGLSTDAIYEKLTTDDVRAASDHLRTVYDQTAGVDGYVSIEVDPFLAHNAEGSIQAARRLWSIIDRPNIMIKIPGTQEGLRAIRTLLAEGININITLLFGLENYEQVANAYIDALSERVTLGKDISHISSVASFFLSRVDTNVDKLLTAQIASGHAEHADLLGKAAVANAKLAYAKYQAIFRSERFLALQKSGSKVQRCLWASVSTKNPAYSDVMYIEPLIGPDTVTTVPDETIHAFADHGRAKATLELGVTEATTVINRLRSIGIDTEQVAAELQDDGVTKFEQAFTSLSEKLETKRSAVGSEAS